MVWSTTDIFELFKRPPEGDDERVLRFIGGKLFWGYRFGLDFVHFQRHDAIRFGVSVADLHHVAAQCDGLLWKRESRESYRALPRLLTDFRAGALPGRERPSLEQVSDLLDATRYLGAHHHLSQAVSLLRSPEPDFANATKEAVAAVESVAKTLLATPTATLGDCIKDLRAAQRISGEIGRILESLYAYRSSSTPGVAHGSITPPSVSENEARLILGLCAPAIEYLDSLWPVLRAGD